MLRQIADGVWWFRLGLVPPFRQNAFLVDDDGAMTLVDAGTPFDVRRLQKYLRAVGTSLQDLDRVLLTHYDLDHVGALVWPAKAFVGTAYLGIEDARLATGEKSLPLLHHKGAFHRAVRRIFRFHDGVDVRPVADGDTVGGFTAYHTPGHNPGHTAFVHHDRGVGFLGDLVWEDDGHLTTPIWFDSYDMTELAASVRRFAARVPDFEIACMGHGEPILADGHRELDRLAARV